VGLFKKSLRRNVLLAVCPNEEGIAVAQVRREKGRSPTLEYCEYLQSPNIHVQNDQLKNLVKNKHLEQIECTSALELGAYSLLLTEAAEVPANELRNAMRWRVRELIDFPADDAVIDVFDVPPQKKGGNRMVYVVAARTPFVKQRVDQLLEAGLKLDVVDIPELCFRNIASLLPEDAGGVAFICLARQRGMLTLTHQGTLYFSRRLQTGAEILWRDNAAIRRDDADEFTAEIKEWLDSIVIELQRSLDYYESNFSVPPIAGVVVAPLGKKVRGIAEYLSSQLGLKCRVLDLNDLIDCPRPVPELAQVLCLPALGAALRSETDAA